MLELVNLLPGGASVVAILCVVILFLRSQRECLKEMRGIGESCHLAQRDSQRLFQDQIGHVVDGFVDESKHTRQTLQRLSDTVSELSRKS